MASRSVASVAGEVPARRAAARGGLTNVRHRPHDDQARRVDEVAREISTDLLRRGGTIELDDHARLRATVVSAAPLLTVVEVDAAVRKVSQQLFGLGPLEPLLEDPDVTELMVNGPGRIWVERSGRLAATDAVIDENMLATVIERIVAPLGLRVDRTAPFLDARLADGSRVHVAVPPLAIDGPYLTIRRFRDQPFTLEDFCSAEVAAVLKAAVQDRASVVVSGGTGSGKTSLLNALAAHLPPIERVVTIEDAAELRLIGDHVVRLEARPANAEGVGGVSIRTLVRNALRMRPDRIVVGEVRGAEALDMLQAMNTGHEGSMSTCHANSPDDALRRIEAMVLMSDVALPITAVRDHLRSALDIVVQVNRGTDGRRRVSDVCRVHRRHEVWLVRDGSLLEPSAGTVGDRS